MEAPEPIFALAEERLRINRTPDRTRLIRRCRVWHGIGDELALALGLLNTADYAAVIGDGGDFDQKLSAAVDKNQFLWNLIIAQDPEVELMVRQLQHIESAGDLLGESEAAQAPPAPAKHARPVRPAFARPMPARPARPAPPAHVAKRFPLAGSSNVTRQVRPASAAVVTGQARLGRSAWPMDHERLTRPMSSSPVTPAYAGTTSSRLAAAKAAADKAAAASAVSSPCVPLSPATVAAAGSSSAPAPGSRLAAAMAAADRAASRQMVHKDVGGISVRNGPAPQAPRPRPGPYAPGKGASKGAFKGYQEWT